VSKSVENRLAVQLEGLTFSTYEKFAAETAEYPHRGKNLLYPAMGLCGEAGEHLDKVKKLWRNHYVTSLHGLQQTLPDASRVREELLKELGDVLWYIAASARELDSSLERVAKMNVAKLLDRKERGVIKSEGDNR
jgi:NTP pyrophosphatase (non-canonical NTP hydrolase)